MCKRLGYLLLQCILVLNGYLIQAAPAPLTPTAQPVETVASFQIKMGDQNHKNQQANNQGALMAPETNQEYRSTWFAEEEEEEKKSHILASNPGLHQQVYRSSLAHTLGQYHDCIRVRMGYNKYFTYGYGDRPLHISLRVIQV
ncbi:hypothetical protein CLV98_102433 [Dyadobacter jejuensis]|uniref:Uncharacterized protein n=1 Tax=Dyadobacter jejuensis TaxID=1082580 RepID=A0A316AQN1_9BACT|nr:hypothetical protein [Dyadobacter jejuensis]PWJ59599.1 hypothetical protein CLV98_102433 [Dyadobacter jejuensis]